MMIQNGRMREILENSYPVYTDSFKKTVGKGNASAWNFYSQKNSMGIKLFFLGMVIKTVPLLKRLP